MGSHATPASHHADQRPGDVAHLHTHGYTPVPWLVQWMATTGCELRCPHCLSGAPSQDDMPLEQALGLVDQVAKLGVPELLVTGGEPMTRRDLGAIIQRMAQRQQRWSLNTAVMPPAALRPAIAAYPPSFVAISLDGPRTVHDRFRGRAGSHAQALEAVRWYGDLPDVHVVAGTTVTTANIGSLPATLHEVMHSGAHAWGLHLCLDEGLARSRPELFPDRSQLAWLLRFTVRARRWFPVSMADEMGYCGEWEPLVRDLPLRCGAGRMQCVVLPDGSVVPCTTMDRSTRAGALGAHSLAEIWEHGFADMRSWRPTGSCASCAYAPACQGGCWLQRRRGNACYRDVWHRPGAMRSAVGLAICLGGLAALQPAQAQDRDPAWTAGLELAAEVPDPVDQAVLAAVAGPVDAQPSAEAGPGQAFVQDWHQGTLPDSLVPLSARIQEALTGSTPSLHLVALCHRALSEASMAAGDPTERDPTEQLALHQAREALGLAALQWRRAILESSLDPYLARGRDHARYHFEGSKAYIPAPTWLSLQRDTVQERWGTADPEQPDPLEGWLDRHPYAEQLDLQLSDLPAEDMTVRGPGTTRKAQPNERMGIFDTLVVPPIQGEVRLGLGDEGGMLVTFHGPIELGWADLLALAWLQHPDTLRARAQAHMPAYNRRGTSDGPVDPLCLLPIMELERDAEQAEQPRLSQVWIRDFWMF